jgi:hypothetical protein
MKHKNTDKIKVTKIIQEKVQRLLLLYYIVRPREKKSNS